MISRAVGNFAGQLGFSVVGIVALTAIVISGIGNIPAVRAQSPVPAFEVASVKPDDFVPGPRPRTGEHLTCGNGRFDSRGMPVWYLVKWAWNVEKENDRLVGYPDWIVGTIYQIEAKSESPVSEDQCRLMLRTLLSDRFGLHAHEETRSIDAFDLVVAKGGPKIHRVADPDDAPVNGPGFAIDGRSMQMLSPSAKGWTMDELASMLFIARLGKKVFNRTGLDGIYRIDMTFRQRDDDSGAGPDVTTALREQLGLELRSAKEPLNVVVVDHIERPSPN